MEAPREKNTCGGTIRGRSTASLYVVIKIDLDGPATDADAMGYSYDKEYGCPFIETIAARDCFGKFWDFKGQGSPCFDPIDDDGNTRPLPKRRFMMWDELDEESPEDCIPRTIAASLTIYDYDAESATHRAARRYKLCMVQPTIDDYVAIETEGDKLFLSQ